VALLLLPALEHLLEELELCAGYGEEEEEGGEEGEGTWHFGGMVLLKKRLSLVKD
jgi:hypothetical protein